MDQPGKHHLTEALKGHTPTPDLHPDDSLGPPQPLKATPDVQAEAARREEEARLTGRTREDHQVTIGRGQQTTGRL